MACDQDQESFASFSPSKPPQVFIPGLPYLLNSDYGQDFQCERRLEVEECHAECLWRPPYRTSRGQLSPQESHQWMGVRSFCLQQRGRVFFFNQLSCHCDNSLSLFLKLFLMWTTFKVFIDSVTILLLFCFGFLAVRHMGILAPGQGIEPAPSASKR